MKLYVYDHCPFCVRARLAFGLKGMPFDLGIILEGDAETPTKMIGKKMVPILQKPDGSYMGESLDIVAYMDAMGEPMFDDAGDTDLDAWGERLSKVMGKLVIPRVAKSDLAEFATPEARAAFVQRKTAQMGDLDSYMADSDTYIAEVNDLLLELDELLEGREEIGISDIKLWPLLRSLTIVDGLEFPQNVWEYMEDLSERGGVPLLFDHAM
ncbi:MAG: glutaredoxin [Pseudomonas fluorescens]|nr:MAG: glutaredoxin [Pseudomonas fluorescens]